MNRGVVLASVLGAAAMVAFGASAWSHWRETRETQALLQLLASTVPIEGRTGIDCRSLQADRPLVLLVLGQSNAGNHGVPGPGGAELRLVAPQGCALTTDPLPGATGEGGSLWSHLPAALQARGIGRPLVLGLLALDGLSAQPWVETGSPVRARLVALVQTMRYQGLTPQFVLWQQGESDARLGTPPQVWQAALRQLAELLTEEGAPAPILLAKSTLCHSTPNARLQDAVAALVATNTRFHLGADTDALNGPAMRHDGCHFSAAGLSAAAGLWADRLAAEIVASSPAGH